MNKCKNSLFCTCPICRAKIEKLCRMSSQIVSEMKEIREIAERLEQQLSDGTFGDDSEDAFGEE